MLGAIKKLRHKHPYAEVLFQHKQVPNAINLFERLRTTKSIKVSRNYCSPTTTERELLEEIKTMCGEDYPAENVTPLNVWPEPPTAVLQSISSQIPTHSIHLTPPHSPSPCVSPSAPPHHMLPQSPPVFSTGFYTCYLCGRVEASLANLMCTKFVAQCTN